MKTSDKNVQPYILLIEDNDDHAVITEKVLKRRAPNYSIKTIKSGKKALEYLRNEKDKFPAFILLDLNLPDISSLKILEAWNSDVHWSKVPVWMQTTWCDEFYLKEAYNLGISGHFEKPLGKNGIDEISNLFPNK